MAKGSFKNKLILVPAALLISAVAPWLITPMLLLGGLFLCFEGFEKVAHKFLHGNETEEEHDQSDQLAHVDMNIEEFEKEKIKGAVRTGCDRHYCYVPGRRGHCGSQYSELSHYYPPPD